jgi:hypothetical protein
MLVQKMMVALKNEQELDLEKKWHSRLQSIAIQ